MWIFVLTLYLLWIRYCSYVIGETTEWSDWSPCSVSCGNGTRNRTRQCSSSTSNDNITCNSEETMECNMTECSGSGNIIIGVVVGVILCLLIISSIIITRHGRCWKRSHKHFDPHKLKEERKTSTGGGDEVDNRLEYENQNNFEPSFITEIATDTGEKFVYINLSQVYYKEKPIKCDVEAVIENEAREKDDGSSVLHYEHRNGEIVNNPIFDEPSDIKSSVNMNGGKDVMFKHSDIETVVDNSRFVDEGDTEIDLESVRSEIDTEIEVSDESNDSEIGNDTDSNISALSESNSVKLKETMNDLDINDIEDSVSHGSDNNLTVNDVVNKDINETVESDIESIKEEINTTFVDPFDALDLIQRASPYLFGEENDEEVKDISILDDVIMEDIHEADDEYLSESELDSEYDYEACSDNDEYETETEYPSLDEHDKSDVSDETIKESDDESENEVGNDDENIIA
ncbi:Isthmin 2b [Mactra antiquata]